MAICVIAAADFPRVEVTAEEDVYSVVPPNNGSGPMWSYGCTQIARLGDDIYISEMESGKDVPPLCNTRWRLLRRTGQGWTAVAEADGYHQREPCPLATVSARTLFLNTNDSSRPAGTKYGPCEPALLRFDFTRDGFHRERLLPAWNGQPHYTDHSYRGFAADERRDRVLMLNIDAKTSVQHACLINAKGKTLATGSIAFPIRACYPQAALRNREAHVLAVGDIHEPVEEWAQYKFAQTKREWDYVFRILYYTWTPDLARENFRAPLEIANVDKTAGAISNQDLWIAPNGDAYIMYTESEVASALMRDKFFPGKSLIPSLHLAVIRNGQVAERHVLIAGTDAASSGGGRFHAAANGRVYAVLHVSGKGGGNQLMPIYPKLQTGVCIPIPLLKSLSSYCLATVRAGNRPSNTIDLHGPAGDVMRYARVELH